MLNLPRCAGVSTFVFLLAVGCGNSPTAPTPPPAGCTYSVAPSSLTVAAAGGVFAASVTTTAACGWTTSAGTSWLATSPSSGTGPGTVTITVQANTSADVRNGSALIGGVSVAIQQAASAPPPCTFVITPTGANFDEEGGNGAVTVTTTGACSWQSTSGAAWLTVLSGGSGTGTGTMTYKVDGNPSPLARTGSLTIAGHTFQIHQTGDVSTCTYQVSPVQLSICMAWTADLVSTITTQDGCPWTAESTTGWMPVTGGTSGAGSGSVRVRGTDNYDAPRSGIVQVRWPTVTAGQNVVVSQAGCSYGVTQTTFNLTAGGGTGRFDVVQQSDPMSCGGPLQNACVWSSVASVPWITITSPTTQTGDEAVTFTVGTNTTGTARTGTITVRDKVVQVNQGG